MKNPSPTKITLTSKVRQEGNSLMVARTRFLHHKTSEILEKEDLEKLWNLLKDHISPPNDMKERINYKYLFNEVIIKKLPTNCPKNAVTFSQPLLF